MSRAWKPGDVAIRKYYGVEQISLFVDCYKEDHEHAGRHHWHHQTGGFDLADSNGPTYRPVVVIDPEDREQVERLTSVLDWALHSNDADELAESLREFADPKPLACGSSVDIWHNDGKTGTTYTCVLGAEHDGMHETGDNFRWGEAS